MKYKNIEIKWLGHSGFLIKTQDKNIFIDPIKLSNDNEKADLILITHSHYDHFSVEDLKKIIKPETKIIGPADILSQIRQIGNTDFIDFKIISPGGIIDIEDIKINAIHSYNINKPYHPKDDWLGYILVVNETAIYHAGDTDLIPEMNNIETDIALLPVSGKFTMNSEEAARAAEIIKPGLAIPMHYSSIIGTINDAERFAEECKKIGINAQILEKE